MTKPIVKIHASSKKMRVFAKNRAVTRLNSELRSLYSPGLKVEEREFFEKLSQFKVFLLNPIDTSPFMN